MPARKPTSSLRNAELVYSQVKMLWDDQVALAKTLVEKRKTFSTMLAILVGLGIFRLQLYRPPDELLVVRGNALLAIRCCLIAALCAFGVGAYFLYTQRPFCRRILMWALDLVVRVATLVVQKSRAPNRDARRAVKLEPAKPSLWPAGRAIAALLEDFETLEDWWSLTPLRALRARTERLRAAYTTLRSQNRRVACRLRDALLMLFLGYALVFATLGMYLWSIA